MKEHNEQLLPHSPDVIERRTSDDGFSAGWGLHHQPAEHYLINMHSHMSAKTISSIDKAFNPYFERAEALRVRRQVVVDGKPDRIAAFAGKSAKDDRFLWMIWPTPRKPDLRFLTKWSRFPGFAGLKLHNNTLMNQHMDPALWLSNKWFDMFEFCARANKPVLWHVTQRLTDSPYMGGGRDSYWKTARAKHGPKLKFGNRQMMDVFLECVARHPRTQFIGAHHLHIGPDSAARLFRKHPNLSVDLSCGNIVRVGDEMYEEDRRTWRDHLIAFADRILFGTDCCLGSTAGNWVLWDSLVAHIRFLHQLHLPADVLNQITHRNFERLAGLAEVPLDPGSWLGVRP